VRLELKINHIIFDISALEHVGSVPFFLLEQVFVRANAHQLVRLEHFNPQFTEDFDDLWKALVNNEFKLAVPQEYECWREVYEVSLYIY
jgi:elongin-A